MIYRLMIPVSGTVAALVVILLAHKPRHEEKFDDSRIDFGDAPEHAEPEEEQPEVPLEGDHFRLELRADGTLVDVEQDVTFASVADLLERVAGGGHTVVLSKGKDTTDAALADAMAKIEESLLSDGRQRFHVSKAAPAESMTFEIELLADGTLLDPAHKTSFASVEALIKELGDARHTLLVSNGKDVAEKDLDAVLAKLREAQLPSGDPRFQVRKVLK